MSQFEAPYADPTQPSATRPKMSGLAVTALVLSIIGVLPCIGVCLAPVGFILGLIGVATTGGTSGRRGRGLAIAAILIAIIGGAVQYVGGQWFYKTFVEPVTSGPKMALEAGFAGDYQGFRAAMYGDATTVSDEQVQAFIDELRSRYGAFSSVEIAQGQRPATGGYGGPASQTFPYLITFDQRTVDAEVEMIFSDEAGGQAIVMKPGMIRIIDPDLGDLTFPPSAQEEDSSGD